MYILEREFKITIDSISGKRLDGIIVNQAVELSEQHVELMAEAIMQVLYNLGLNSQVEFNYDMRIKDGTSFFVHGSDVTIIPPNGESYRRRIRNDSKIIKK